MGQFTLFGVAPWVNTWLTPLWLVSVGVVVGLVGLLAVWGLAAAVSRLPGMDMLAHNRPLRHKLAAAGTLITVPIYVWLASQAWAGGGKDVAVNFLFGAIALSPICWMIPHAILTLAARRTVTEVPAAVQEGVLLPLFWITIAFAVFSVIGVLAIRAPMDFLASMKRWHAVGEDLSIHELAAADAGRGGGGVGLGDAPLQPIQVNFRRNELRNIMFRSTERLEVHTAPLQENLSSGRKIDVTANENSAWLVNAQTLTLDFSDEQVTKLYVRNLGERPATLHLTVVTSPPIPEVSTIPITAIAVLAAFLLYILQRATMPRLSAVALATFKSEVAQPLFAILVILGVGLLIMFVYIPYNTFGEDIKMLKDSGLALITVLGLIQATWAASTSISEEIEGRTALTVLSKPIGRRSFIIGKFLGITWTVGLIFVILGLVFLVTVAYKPIYDVREGATYYTPDGQQLDDATWQLCHGEMVRVVPGLLLAFMQTMVLAAISVAISTRLPMMANFIICFTVYVLGNLAPMIVQSSGEQFVLVKFFGQLIATIFPNLENFNIQAAVAGGRDVPMLYLTGAFLYCLIYTVIAMLLALIMFEDRDLA